jgi:hypothetical protein
MSDLDLDRLEALASAATPGPWYWQQTKLDINLVSRSRWSPIILGFGRWGMNRAQPLVQGDGLMFAKGSEIRVSEHRDTAFIAAAREAVPALIAEVRRLREAISGSPDKTKRLASLVAASTRLVQIERDDARARAEKAQAERDTLAVKVAAVKALCADADRRPNDWRGLVSTFYLRKALEVEPGRAGTGMSDQLYRFTSVEAVQRHTDSPPEIPEDQIGVQAAIDTIARAIIASAAEDAGEWEDWPEVGEHDWNRVLEAVKRLAPWPDDAERSAAYQLLESMSDDEEWLG